MARFSRLRRSAALLLFTAGFGGLVAGSAKAEGWSCGFIAPSESHQKAKDSAFWGLLEARRSGFNTMVQEAATQEFGSRPMMANGKTLAQVILKSQTNVGPSALLRLQCGTQTSAVEVACAGALQACGTSANEAHLELLSLQFRAIEQIEAAAKTHCREFAQNTHLFGSIVSSLTAAPQSTNVEVPGFSFTTVTTTVSVPDGGTVLIGARKFEQHPTSRSSSDAAEAAGMSASRQLVISASSIPLVLHHVGADGLERIGIDFELNRELGNGPMRKPMIMPRIIITEEEDERLLGTSDEVAPPAPRTLAAAMLANRAKRARQIHCVQISPADYIEVSAYRAVTSSYEALIDMPFSMDKLVELSVEASPAPGCMGDPNKLPVLRMSSMTQERMMRHLANAAAENDDCPGFKCADANISANSEYQFPNVNEWKQLNSGCTFGSERAEKPILRMPSRIPERLLRLLTTKSEQKFRQLDQGQALLEDSPGFKYEEIPAPISETEFHFPVVTSWKQLEAKRTDAAPAENPEETGIEPYYEEFVQQLPPRGDAPLANPAYVTATPRVVSPTMSPLEYAETFLTMDERNNLPEGTELLLSDHQALTGRMIRIGGLGYEEDTIIRTINRFGNTVLEQQRDDQVKQTAHDEPAKACDNPVLRALGGPISVTPCESETCRGFIIQFAPCEKPAAVAEVEAFDGPAQVTLQDGPNKSCPGFTLQVQPVNEESLDDCAQRLEREFLRRAVNGQIQVPEACAAPAKPAFKQPELTCPGGCEAKVGDKCGCIDPFLIGNCPTGHGQASQCQPSLCLPSQSQANACQPGTCGNANCLGCPPGAPCCLGNACVPAVASPTLPWPVSRNPGVCGNIAFDPYLPAPPACGVTAAVPCFGVAPCCNANNQASAAGCQCAECPKGCGGECCCAKKDHGAVPAVTWNPYVTEPATMPSCTVPAPQLAMVPQTPPKAYWPAVSAPRMAPPVAPVMVPTRTAANPELLEVHRDISRTLDQLAERCETQGLYEKADELRDLAREYRMGARVIHQHLNAMTYPMGPMPAAQPVAWYPAPPMMPYPMPAPPTYAPEPMPTFGAPPSSVAPGMYPQQFPIAQPMMVPRY